MWPYLLGCSQLKKTLRLHSQRFATRPAPSVSIQGLARERNLRCQIKHQSFPGSVWVSRWISRCLARPGRDACTAHQEMLGRGMHRQASSPAAALEAMGRKTSLLSTETPQPTLKNRVGRGRADISLENCPSGLNFKTKAGTSEWKMDTVGTWLRSDGSLSREGLPDALAG